MKLVFKGTEKVVDEGTQFNHDDGKAYVVTDIEEPHKPESSGFVSCREVFSQTSNRYYASVWGMEFIEREDRD